MRRLVDFKNSSSVTLDRLQPHDRFEDLGSQPKVGLVIDCETTGVDSKTDEIIEICLLPFTFDQSGRVGEVLGCVEMLNEPSKPITPEVTRVTGLAPADVAGKKIDRQVLESVVKRADLVIAHHARFDRGFVDRYLPDWRAARKPWVCTMEDVDWSGNDVGSSKLDYLGYRFGFFFDAHRAEADCRATLEILASAMPDGRTVLAHSFAGLAPKVLVRAEKSPFDSKDKLKSRGYRWDPDLSTWWKEIRAEDADQETIWLKDEVYKGWCGASFRPVDILERFTSSS